MVVKLLRANLELYRGCEVKDAIVLRFESTRGYSANTNETSSKRCQSLLYHSIQRYNWVYFFCKWCNSSISNLQNRVINQSWKLMILRDKLEIADTSQSKELSLPIENQIDLEPCTNYPSHGRPMRMIGNNQLALQRKIVVLLERLVPFSTFVNNTATKLKIPAWPIPTHQTELVISMPNNCFCLIPSTYTCSYSVSHTT
jgi:hypothetical protein